MHRPFPDPDEAIGMDVQDLAMCVLDRLAATDSDRRGELMTREGFVNHHVLDVYGKARRKLEPRGAITYDTRTATEAFPEYSLALAEAWAFLQGQGFLVSEPGSPTSVFIGKRGAERLAAYRGRTVPVEPLPTAVSAPSEGSSDEAAPTAAVLWAHGDPHWAADEEAAWERSVLDFTHLLIAHGIDADLDLFHGHTATDWSRFGSSAIQSSDYVLVAVSAMWRRAWEGKTEPGEAAGALGEANLLRGLLKQDSRRFLQRVIPVVLPGRTEADIPVDLHATAHWEAVPTLDEDGIERLLRRLTNQPAYPKPPLGKVPILPPRASRGSAPPRTNALQLKPHPNWTTGAFNLHLPAGPLNAHLVSEGGVEIDVLGAELHTSLGIFKGSMYVDVPPPLLPEPTESTRLPANGHLTVLFGEGELASLPATTDDLRLVLRYGVTDEAKTYEYRLPLHRAASTPTSRPQWRAGAAETVAVA